MEESNDGPFEFGTSGATNGVWTEGLPDDTLADIRGDKEGDARSQTITFGQQLVEADHDETRHEQLNDDQNSIHRTDVAYVSVHSGNDVRDSFANGDEYTQQLLCTGQEISVCLDTVVHVNDFGSGEELHDQSGCYDGTDAQFHAGSTIGCHDDTDPVERIGSGIGLDSVKGQLRTDQEHKERHRCVDGLFFEGNSTVGLCHIG